MISFVNKNVDSWITIGSDYPHTIWALSPTKLFTVVRQISTKNIVCFQHLYDGSSGASFTVHNAAVHGGDAGPPSVALGNDGNLHFVYPVGTGDLGYAEFTTGGAKVFSDSTFFAEAGYDVVSAAIVSRPSGTLYVTVELRKAAPVDYKIKRFEINEATHAITNQGDLYSGTTLRVQPSMDWDAINGRFYLAYTEEVGSSRVNKLVLLNNAWTILDTFIISQGIGYGSVVGVAVSSNGFLNTVTQMSGNFTWQRWAIAATISPPDRIYGNIVNEASPVMHPTMSVNKDGGYLQFVGFIPTNENVGLWRWVDPDQDSIAPGPPYDLLTNDIANPLNVDPATTINFKFKPPVNMTAYQIEISDNLQFSNIIWDSTKTALVKSAGQVASVNYGGSTLSEDETYYWRCRIWDAGDNEGAYAEAAQFRTGFADSFMLGDLGNEYVFAVAPWPYEEPEQKFIDVKRQVDKRGNFYSFDPYASPRVDIRSAPLSMIEDLRQEWERGIPLVLVPYPRSDKILDFRNKVSGSDTPIPHSIYWRKTDDLDTATIPDILNNGTEFNDGEYSDVSRRDDVIRVKTSASNSYVVLLVKFDLAAWITANDIESIKRLLFGFVGDGKLWANTPEKEKWGWRIEVWSNKANAWALVDYNENRPADTSQLDIGHFAALRHEISAFINNDDELYFRLYLPHPRNTGEGQNHHEFWLDFVACYINSFPVAINEFGPAYVAPFTAAGFDITLNCQEV